MSRMPQPRRWRAPTNSADPVTPGQPAPGDDPHHYVFRLLAVDEPVRLTRPSSYQDVEAAVTGHVLGEARLIGTYQR